MDAIKQRSDVNWIQIEQFKLNIWTGKQNETVFKENDILNVQVVKPSEVAELRGDGASQLIWVEGADRATMKVWEEITVIDTTSIEGGS